MRRILVPLDVSHATPMVVKAAFEMAGELGSRTTLLHVTMIDSISIGYDLDSAVGREVTAELLRRDHRWLLALEEDLAGRGLDVTAVLRRGDVVPEILREAGRLLPHYIVMGSHGHSAVHHLLLGSVTAGVLHSAPCPVLIVPTRQGAKLGEVQPAAPVGLAASVDPS